MDMPLIVSFRFFAFRWSYKPDKSMIHKIGNKKNQNGGRSIINCQEKVSHSFGSTDQSTKAINNAKNAAKISPKIRITRFSAGFIRQKSLLRLTV